MNNTFSLLPFARPLSWILSWRRRAHLFGVLPPSLLPLPNSTKGREVDFTWLIISPHLRARGRKDIRREGRGQKNMFLSHVSAIFREFFRCDDQFGWKERRGYKKLFSLAASRLFHLREGGGSVSSSLPPLTEWDGQACLCDLKEKKEEEWSFLFRSFWWPVALLGRLISDTVWLPIHLFFGSRMKNRLMGWMGTPPPPLFFVPDGWYREGRMQKKSARANSLPPCNYVTIASFRLLFFFLYDNQFLKKQNQWWQKRLVPLMHDCKRWVLLLLLSNRSDWMRERRREGGAATHRHKSDGQICRAGEKKGHHISTLLITYYLRIVPITCRTIRYVASLLQHFNFSHFSSLVWKIRECHAERQSFFLIQKQQQLREECAALLIRFALFTPLIIQAIAISLCLILFCALEWRKGLRATAKQPHPTVCVGVKRSCWLAHTHTQTTPGWDEGLREQGYLFHPLSPNTQKSFFSQFKHLNTQFVCAMLACKFSCLMKWKWLRA